MKLRTLASLLFAIAIFFLFTPSVFADTISKFDTSIEIQTDGSIHVAEHILYDFGDAYRHGIYRNIPYIKVNTDGKKYIVDLRNFSVANGGLGSYTFTQSTNNNEKQLKIGDANSTITGEHQYDISYDARGALTYFSDHDELYWNVTGNGWDYPMDEVSANIVLPQNLMASEVRLSCFIGIAGSTNQQCSATYAGGGRAIIKALKPLVANEGLTVVVGFPKNIVAVLEPKLYIPFWETLGGKVLIALLILIGLYWYVYLPISIPIKWWRIGRDPKPAIGETTAWFEPPKTRSGRKLTPGETGTLVDEKAEMKDLTSTIISLAQRGYLKILEQKKGNFQLEKVTGFVSEEQIQPFEQMLMDGIFEKGNLISLRTISLVTVVENARNKLYDAVVAEGYFDKNPQSTRNNYIILAIFGLITGNILLLLVALLFGLHMPRKTQFGSEQAAIARSLKNFLTSQERQLAFQAKNQIFFEKLLPFAIAFGVEKIWAKRFSDINMTQPGWYQGYSTGRFNSLLFVNSLSSTGSSFAKAATPVSSSTGHSSGFSGGFSGGGGGGGGGGSW